MSACRSCGAPVIWTITEDGKAMPVDRDPVDGGNLVLVMDQGKAYARVVSLFTDWDGDRYVSHFVTCNDPERWRKRGKKK